MSTVRVPYWLSYEQRAVLEGAITGLLTGCAVMPLLRDRLTGVLVELGVTAARDQVLPGQADLVRRTAGYGDDVMPVRMSDEEVAAVLSLAGLPEPVRGVLGGADHA